MAGPTEVELPSYIIYRDIEPGQPVDPTAPLLFFPPKGSDELFDALRNKYPHLKSHSERVREAVIEYLLEETEMEQIPKNPMPTPYITQLPSTILSQGLASLPSASSTASTWSSPEIPSLVNSSFGESPPAQALSRHRSSATSATAHSEPSPPALEQMTGVFSLSDANQPKQRMRRKMTEQEKVEYRKRRIVKACDKCSKRKRKCNHNQQDMESVSRKSHTMPRSSEESMVKKPPDQDIVNITPPEETLAAPSTEFADPFSCDLLQPFVDLGDFLEAPLPDLSFDDLLAPSQTQWPWTHTPDFTLMDISGDSFSPGPEYATGHEYDVSPRDTILSDQSDSISSHSMSQYMDTEGMSSPAVWSHPGNNQQVSVPQFTQLQETRDAQAERAIPGRVIEEFEHGLIGDGRRTTHSQVPQALQNSATIQGTRRQEVNMAVERDSTNTPNQPLVIDVPQHLNRTDERWVDIHTQVDREKRKAYGIDAGSMIPAGQNGQSSQDQQQFTALQSPQSLSLGELGDGIIANTSPRAELFMLRRRITRPRPSVVDRDSSINASDSSVMDQTVSPLQRHTASHTERSTIVSHNTEQNGLHAVQANGSTRSALCQLERTAVSNSGFTSPNILSARSRALELISETLTASDCTSCGDGGSNLQQLEFHSERLSDHVRRRDHFGRSLDAGLQVLGAVAGLGCLFMLLSMLPSHTSDLSLLLLALASPVRGAKGTHLPNTFRFCSEVWGTLCQEGTKSSTWWASVNTQKLSLLQERETRSGSKWVKETGQVSYGSSWHQWGRRKECVLVDA